MGPCTVHFSNVSPCVKVCKLIIAHLILITVLFLNHFVISPPFVLVGILNHSQVSYVCVSVMCDSNYGRMFNVREHLS